MARSAPSLLAVLLAFACNDEPLRAAPLDAGSDASFENGGAGGHAGDGGTGNGGESGMAGSDDGFEPPLWISETGLFDDIRTRRLAEGVRPFTPQYQLWSDGALKQRWLYLPPGTQIDTSDMNYWRYPVGTKAWKEFGNSLRRIETRLLWKLDEERWFMMAFRWNAEMTDAIAVPEGEKDARNTQHDVPSSEDCVTCHDNHPDTLLGFTAIQLSHGQGGVTLDTLIGEDLLSEPPAQAFVVPGSDVERNALGYLHANCGVCHQPESFVSTEVDMELWLRTDSLGSVQDTPAYLTAVAKPPRLDDFPDATALLEPGDREHSAVFLRMSSRDGLTQMPPLASEQVDPDGLEAIGAFIDGLSAP